MHTISKLALIALLLALLVSACAPRATLEPEPTSEAVKASTIPSETPAPTTANPPVFTETPAPSPTTAPSETPIPSATSAPTLSATPAPSATSAPAGQAVTITGIQMFSDLAGFGVSAPEIGEDWTLLRTADGGKTWAEINPPAGYGLSSRFYALDAQHIWAAPSNYIPGEPVQAGYVYRSSDGGATWSASQPIELSVGEDIAAETFFPNALFFLDQNTGWLVASIGHYMNQDVIIISGTSDGGKTWTRLTDKMSAGSAGGEGMPCLAAGLVFTSAQHGYLAGNCLHVGMDERWHVLESQDGGRTWNYLTLPAPTATAGLAVPAELLATDGNTMCAPSGASFFRPSTVVIDYTCQIWIPDSEGKEYHLSYVSSNNGAAWTGSLVSSLNFYTTLGGMGAGFYDAGGKRPLLFTSDGGKTWTATGRQVTWPNVQFNFTNDQTGFALAWKWNEAAGQTEYALVHTTNGGGTWKLVTTTLGD